MDFNVLAANLGLERVEFIELVELFVETAESDIQKIKTSHAQNDTEQIAEAAHSLKGSAGNLGFAELSDKAKLIEDNSRNETLEGLEELTRKIEEMLEKIRQVVTK